MDWNDIDTDDIETCSICGELFDGRFPQFLHNEPACPTCYRICHDPDEDLIDNDD